MNTEPPPARVPVPEVIDLDSDDWLRIAERMEMGSVCDLLRREGTPWID